MTLVRLPTYSGQYVVKYSPKYRMHELLKLSQHRKYVYTRVRAHTLGHRRRRRHVGDRARVRVDDATPEGSGREH